MDSSFPAKENPNMEKALFDGPVVLQYDVKAKYWLLSRNREEKLLRHVAMVAKFLDDKKPIKSVKSLLAPFQTSPILFNFT